MFGKFKDPIPEQIFAKKHNLDKIRADALETLRNFEQDKYLIDQGGVGKVYELPQGFCVKILDDRHNSPNKHLMDLGNTPIVEATYLDRVSQTEWSGKTRTPKYFGVVTSSEPGGLNAIIMERLNAVNLQHVLNGTAELPSGFDLEEFFNELESFIQHMHEIEKIAHKDLLARNIMIDIETGDPRVIDFGRSKLLTSFNQNDRDKVENDHFERLEEVYEELKLYINKKNAII